MRAANCQKRILLLGVFRHRNVAVGTLLKMIAPWVTQKGTHGPSHVDFNLLVSCEQNLITFWARQCPYGRGTQGVKGSPVRVHTRKGSMRFCPLYELDVLEKAANGLLLIPCQLITLPSLVGLYDCIARTHSREVQSETPG